MGNNIYDDWEYLIFRTPLAVALRVRKEKLSSHISFRVQVQPPGGLCCNPVSDYADRPEPASVDVVTTGVGRSMAAPSARCA
jgi:hypothetical protein